MDIIATTVLQVYKPYKATLHDMCTFHSEDYIKYLERLAF